MHLRLVQLIKRKKSHWNLLRVLMKIFGTVIVTRVYRLVWYTGHEGVCC